jgi:YVTN family beta-propeller protein
MHTLQKLLSVTIALAAPALAAETVYIPLGAANAVAIVDAGTDRVTGRIGGLPEVHGLAGTPDGRWLVAGSEAERAAGGKLPARPAGVSESDREMHDASTGRPASAAAAVSTVSIVRAADRKVVRRVDVPGAVHHATVSPDGRLAVFTHPKQGGISVLDLTAYRVVASVATGPDANYAVFDPAGKRVFVTNGGNATVSEVDAERWIVRRNVAVGQSPEHVALSHDGGALFVNNVADGTVSVVDVRTGEATRAFAVGSMLHGIDVSDDGETLFVAAMRDNKLVAVDIASGARRAVLLAPAPYHLAAIRGTGKVYVSSAQQPKVWVIDQKTLAVRGEIPLGGKGHQMVQLSR